MGAESGCKAKPFRLRIKNHKPHCYCCNPCSKWTANRQLVRCLTIHYCLLPIANCQLLLPLNTASPFTTAYCPQQTANCYCHSTLPHHSLLPTAHSKLPTATATQHCLTIHYCLLPTANCQLLLPLNTASPFTTAYCPQQTANCYCHSTLPHHSLLPTAHGKLPTAHSKRHSHTKIQLHKVIGIAAVVDFICFFKRTIVEQFVEMVDQHPLV